MPKMSTDRLAAHLAMKRRALELLESLNGEDIQIGAMRDRLGITSEVDKHCLALALEELRDKDHKAAGGRARGWWRAATPAQQALPVGVAASPPQTGLEPETVKALRERLAMLREAHPNHYGGAFCEWLAEILTKLADVTKADGAAATRRELIAVAAVCLRIYEEWER